MSIIYILIPIAIILTSIAIYLFFWAVKTEQFEDLEKQGMSILFDDKDNIDNDNSLNKNNQKKNKQNNTDTK
jgi:cbb3-type cytochrome oxidase maturation protein